jgi:hypothetical protein
MKIKQFID